VLDQMRAAPRIDVIWRERVMAISSNVRGVTHVHSVQQPSDEESNARYLDLGELHPEATSMNILLLNTLDIARSDGCGPPARDGTSVCGYTMAGRHGSAVEDTIRMKGMFPTHAGHLRQGLTVTPPPHQFPLAFDVTPWSLPFRVPSHPLVASHVARVSSGSNADALASVGRAVQVGAVQAELEIKV